MARAVCDAALALCRIWNKARCPPEKTTKQEISQEKQLLGIAARGWMEAGTEAAMECLRGHKSGRCVIRKEELWARQADLVAVYRNLGFKPSLLEN